MRQPNVTGRARVAEVADVGEGGPGIGGREPAEESWDAFRRGEGGVAVLIVADGEEWPGWWGDDRRDFAC